MIISRIKKLINNDSPDFNTKATLLDAGVDSLLAVELIKNVNTQFGINLSDTAVFDFPTTDQLAEHVIGLLGRRCVGLPAKLPYTWRTGNVVFIHIRSHVYL